MTNNLTTQDLKDLALATQAISVRVADMTGSDLVSLIVFSLIIFSTFLLIFWLFCDTVADLTRFVAYRIALRLKRAKKGVSEG
ncbi:hypothetical protein GKT70_13820 [Salmonella enterica]|nr:hypothetical protein [Salmonella enterica]